MQKLYRLLLKQHSGLSSIAVVNVGDIVKKGTLIGASSNEGISANIHASVSGTVAEVTKEYIAIEADEKQTEEYVKVEGDSILELIKAAGIVGMGGAGFPTDVKLKKKLNDGIVILNAAECEPILSHNIYSIEKNPGRVYRGLLYTMEAIGASKGIIAIKEKHKEAINAFKDVIDRENVEIHLLPDMYPMGEKRAIIREVLGILLNVNQSSSEANAVVINSETVSRITDAVELRKPVITKDITVSGKIKSDEPIKVFTDVPIGTSVETVLNNSGGVEDDFGEIIMGGPFLGKSTTLDSPITKTTGGIIATMPFINEKRKMGLLVCACGGNEERLREIAGKMGAPVIGVEYCKQAIQARGKLSCANPGKCPGQSQKVLKLKKEGAEVLLMSNCTDCSNTVMTIAPKLKMPVYHCTDGALRAAGMRLVRKLPLSK
ncbi:proline reductase-associated electron transfer protein PrdC [Clostridium beijerinckii]|jgi:proline reductase-associated electron transfer protein PrdC|uniref:Proline reductase-associated electron transfer protein PrdC n=1 Tax=Clostridium beijerinckii TaxID=1520 RepID=A0AAW3WA97_CLOBE|nr:proline reductase-associated electron transfer protein PrdC [Clostridium beijerinckii]MBC2458370.1 proline reductase-associated electron transfer protein PrdC [Clostridium beijerinckii]MBC2475708.1 proline reductase-associated electron transfer protein PrdC [Clostridium beijerinckii]MCI1579297.1 proline reductase-associated electron transfer protein PrdC [Clostridium beijerinckii]MCI1584391.1 proline reductase-associated electron transfer protein PrdC [Clostridium beijerinckii]MCI1622509.1 